jgi:hypothetical protein
LNADAYEELYRDRLMAQYGEERLIDLTSDEIEQATDP